MGARGAHWDAIYAGRPDDSLSWHEDAPEQSLRLILDCCAAPP